MSPIDVRSDLVSKLKEEKQFKPMSFDNFLGEIEKNPDIVLRNIFQLFHDMVHYYVPPGVNDNPNDPESINFMNYDFTELFSKGIDTNFFPDNLFGNRLMNLVDSWGKSSNPNTIYMFEGPAGSGKSIFINNLIQKLQTYTKLPEGAAYETLWKLDIKEIGEFQQIDFPQADTELDQEGPMRKGPNPLMNLPDTFVEVPCPHHDHPILQIPKNYRKEFLESLILNKDVKEKIFEEKQYEWIFDNDPCTICTSIFQNLSQRDIEPNKILDMIYARRSQFNRRTGEGTSVVNPGDFLNNRPNGNPVLQFWLNSLLKDSNAVKFLFSDLARTNNGVYVLMDLKENNKKRLTNLHGIISDGTQKTDSLEEIIHSLFVGITNPEDKKIYSAMPSFKDRVVEVKIPYVLDYQTEVKIYKNEFGDSIGEDFLPGVLENFAKIIISSRLQEKSKTLEKWIGDNALNYLEFLDENLALLKMEIYTAKTPEWLNDEDSKGFDKTIRRELIAESEAEGFEGISGRQSIKELGKFMRKPSESRPFFTMEMVKDFFKEGRKGENAEIKSDFIPHVVNLYDFEVLQQVKKSLYNYNEERISSDVKNYMFVANHDVGQIKECPYTKEKVDITEEYFRGIETILLGGEKKPEESKTFRNRVAKTFSTKTLAMEIKLQGAEIHETEQYQFLIESYLTNIKENVLLPYIGNENFKSAIRDFGNPNFNKYDSKIQRSISHLLENLEEEFGYTLEGARHICQYVLKKNLAQKFGSN